MIFDAENTFFWHKELNKTTTATSDVIKTSVGDAGCPLAVYIAAPGTSADLTVTLETAATEDFKTPVALASYTVTAQKPVKAKMPYGDLGYLRLKYTANVTGEGATLTAGTLDAALVMDVDLT